MKGQIDMANMTINDLRKNSLPAIVEQPATSAGFSTAGSFELIQRAAKCLASSDLLPERYRGNIPNAVIALDMANRMGAAPLMVCQNLYVVHGTPSWSAQFLVATFNQCGKYSALRYQFEGEPGTDGWGCRAWAVELATGERLDGSLVTIGLAKSEGWYGKAGSKWKTMPEQMLRYRAAAWFIRAHAPEIAMGLPMREEIIDTYTVPEEAAAETAEAVEAPPAPAPKPRARKEKPAPETEAEPEAEHETAPESNPETETATHLQLVPESEGEVLEAEAAPASAGKPNADLPEAEAAALTGSWRALYDALLERTRGNESAAGEMLQTLTGGRYSLGDIPDFTDFVCNNLLSRLRQDYPLERK